MRWITIFTGIVEETGSIASIKKGPADYRLQIQGNMIFKEINLGDSVAVNGVCLTVTQIAGTTFFADVMNETKNRSSLGNIKVGSKVNLERAMAANGRFGGHMVSGHIDGTGTIKQIQTSGNAVLYTIETTENVIRYVVEKGSVAIDGISLTVAAVSRNSFKISVIPHTVKMTTLSEKRVGSIVNIENDMVGKYIEKAQSNALEQDNKPKSNITMEFLAKAGF